MTVHEYTVSNIQGTYEYVEYNSELGAMVPSGLVAGIDDPKTTKSKRTGKMLSTNKHEKKFNKEKNKAGTNDQRHVIAHIEGMNGIPNEQSHVAWRRTAVIGNKKNLMVPFFFL